MALVLKDRVQETSTANTTVSFSLAGAVTGFKTFSSAIGNTNTTYYSATDASGNWEVGIGTYATTGNLLTRTTILASSNADAAVTFSGTVTVFVTYPADKAIYEDASGNASALGVITSATLTNATGLPLTTGVTGTLPAGNGGTAQSTYATGDILYSSAANTLSKLTIGTVGQKLSIASGIPSWLSSSSASVFTTGSAQTYTVPAGVTRVKVTIQGPGGNGGAAVNQRATGGSAGGTCIKWLTVAPGNTMTYTVGTASGTASTVTFSAVTYTANSGSNGAGTAYAASYTAGPTGGTATNGDINITGQSGGNSYGSGTTVTTNFSGPGANSLFGKGGQAIGLVATAGISATGYGAGGGGAVGNNTNGTGSGGIIIFEPY